MNYDTDEKKCKLREEILKRNADQHPNRAKILDDLGEKWAATGNWRMRKDIGTAAGKIEAASEVIANSEKYDPWQVAECMIELRDAFQMFLGLMMMATGEAAPPVDVPRLVHHTVEIRGQLREMECDLHHSDLTMSSQDRCAGEMMAHKIGDLFIDSAKQSPVEQWSKVMRALRAHGYDISFPANV